jgi:anti-sigma factor RsiW
MSRANVHATCALGLDAHMISAWRDGAITPTMAQRIAAHFDGCRACQAHMAAFESVAEALRRQRLPGRPRQTLWREIQARRSDTTPVWRRPLHILHAPLWAGAGALAAALLVALLFVHRGIPCRLTGTLTA